MVLWCCGVVVFGVLRERRCPYLQACKCMRWQMPPSASIPIFINYDHKQNSRHSRAGGNPVNTTYFRAAHHEKIVSRDKNQTSISEHDNEKNRHFVTQLAESACGWWIEGVTKR